MKKVLYFSLNYKTREAFTNYAELVGAISAYSFRIIEKDHEFPDILELFHVLDSMDDLGRLYVIVDYVSLCDFRHDHESFEESQDLIRRAILKYPEVHFFFDESHGEKSFSYVDFLLGEAEEQKNNIYQDYHSFNINSANPFEGILNNWDNMFDGSCLRYAVKALHYNKINVKKHNFSLSQESRHNNLALCVEEEHSQNRFNSYSLFANGFRVLPVKTSEELKRLNESNDDLLKPTLIIRDFDLQFADIERPWAQSFEGNEIKFNTIDYIRGGKFWDQSDTDCPDDEYMNKWSVPTIQNNVYWNNLSDIPTLFITKGSRGRFELCLSQRERRKGINAQRQEKITKKDSKIPLFVDKIPKQYFLGLAKPVSGIYIPFHRFSSIRNRYGSFEITTKRAFKKRDKKEQSQDTKRQAWEIETGREHHDHGVPLDVYEMVKSMISRAKRYYKVGKLVRAAVLATEAIEVLNGFHEALMLQAYHILAVSENALAMSAIGGSERELSRDAAFHIKKIQYEVNRMMYREGEDRRSFKYNVLNQIFSDCRLACKEKEHFGAEGYFIRAMGHVKEGYTPGDIAYALKRIRKRFSSNFKQLVDFVYNG